MGGLTKAGQGNWAVQNFLLRYTGGGNGWLRTNKQYKNYSAVIVWDTNPANVADAIQTVRPFGVDVCSGLRSDAKLDESKLPAFVAAVAAVQSA